MTIKPIIRSVFFGNYFYGICAIALSVEASLQQLYPLNYWWYYLAVAALTIWYYTKAYITDQTAASANIRTNWYVHNKSFVKWSQHFMEAIILATGLYFLLVYGKNIVSLSLTEIILTTIFPLIAVLYYGINFPIFGYDNLRNIGWLKPFVIGFIWAGLVTIYPIIFHQIIYPARFDFQLFNLLLFVKNFMFVTVLCIMFDIKDYAMDYNQQLKTFVVETGLRKTIFYILIPLCIAGLGSFLLYGGTHQFSLMKIVLNTIPFISTIAVAYSLHKRKTILYYLILIDGLMLLKAVCGSTAMIFF